jgi:predicted methyltransferase
MASKKKIHYSLREDESKPVREAIIPDTTLKYAESVIMNEIFNTTIGSSKSTVSIVWASDEIKVFNLVNYTSIKEIVFKSNIPAIEVFMIITKLERHGLIEIKKNNGDGTPRTTGAWVCEKT